jgi:Holliday junction resolvase
MSINSRQKGTGAEREFAGLIHDWSGVRLIRNLEQTRSGGHDLIVHPDEVGSVAESFRQLAIECKRYQTVTDAQIQKWWAQAIIQAEQAGLKPVLAYRVNRSAWRVVVPMALINPAMVNFSKPECTVTLSVEVFCMVISEMPEVDKLSIFEPSDFGIDLNVDLSLDGLDMDLNLDGLDMDLNLDFDIDLDLDKLGL